MRLLLLLLLLLLHTHTYTHTHTHTHTHAHSHSHRHTRARAHTHIHIHTHTNTHTHTHTHARARARTHARTHTRTHARTHAHTHTHSLTLVQRMVEGRKLVLALGVPSRSITGSATLSFDLLHDMEVWPHGAIVLLSVGCLTSQQQAGVSQGLIYSDNFTYCHTEIQVADHTFHLTQSQYTDTGLTSLGTDPITPGAWQGSHRSANF